MNTTGFFRKGVNRIEREHIIFNNRIFFVLFSVLFFSGCKSLDKFTQFYIAVSESVTIEPTIPINVPFDIPTPPIKLNTQESFEINNTHKDLIQEIYLSELNMTVISPEGEDFSLLKSIEIFIASEGESEEMIAWLNPVPAANKISLQLSTNDLKRFILKDDITLKVKTITDEINTRAYTIQIDAKFKLNANILGI